MRKDNGFLNNNDNQNRKLQGKLIKSTYKFFWFLVF
jgi:hypothetical protein